MTRVVLIGTEDNYLPSDLFSFETARDALSTYTIEEPYHNTVMVETISIGAAVSLLNDLDWYLVRLVRDALVLEPSISDTEWLSRRLATQIRNDTVDHTETGQFLKIYGIRNDDSNRSQLMDPLYARRINGSTPSYDLHNVSSTLVIRVSPEEFGTT